LFGHGAQRFFEGHSRAHQGGELSRQQRDVGGLDRGTPAERPALRTRWCRTAVAPLAADRHHLQGQPLFFAQQLTDLPRTVALQHAALFAAAGIEGGVLVSGHLSPRG